MIKFAIAIPLAILIPSLERAPAAPGVAQARWPGGASQQIPLFDGACPPSFAAWRYDKRRLPICVQRA